MVASTRRLFSLGQIVATPGALEALERIGHQRFDLVFMDVQMPEMDGMTATGRIRQSDLSASTIYFPSHFRFLIVLPLQLSPQSGIARIGFQQPQKAESKSTRFDSRVCSANREYASQSPLPSLGTRGEL